MCPNLGHATLFKAKKCELSGLLTQFIQRLIRHVHEKSIMVSCKMIIFVDCIAYLSMCVSIGFDSEVAKFFKKSTETHSIE